MIVAPFPTHFVSDSLNCRWSQRTGISQTFPGDAEAVVKIKVVKVFGEGKAIDNLNMENVTCLFQQIVSNPCFTPTTNTLDLALLWFLTPVSQLDSCFSASILRTESSVIL